MKRRFTSAVAHAGAALSISIALCYGAPAAAQDVPIVYVRCARTTGSVDLTGEVVIDGTSRSVTRTMVGLDVYDVLPDVTHFHSGFSAPCDLVLRQPSGEERVLYDCSSSSSDASSCAAMDPVVSFDGATIAFAIFRGTLVPYRETVHPRVLDPRAENTTLVVRNGPNRTLQATEAQLYLIDVASGALTALPHIEGVFDAGPTFLPNGRLAFTSDRDGNFSTLIFGTNSVTRGSRIWTMDLDGRNLDLASHHSLAGDEHPIILHDGRVAYSSWQIFGGLPFRHNNGSPGGATTATNLFHIYTQSPDGAAPFAFYGQHSGDHQHTTSIGASHTAAHFLAQTTDGRVWFADYYRGNNNGLGMVIGVMPAPAGQEGIGPTPGLSPGDVYAPHDAINLARWTSNADQMSSPMPAPELRHPSYSDPLPFAGRLGHPAALPEGQLMVVWGKGPCSTVSSNDIFAALGRTAPPFTSGTCGGCPMNVVTSLGLDTPGCDAGLYLATRIPSMHPSDLQMVVDSPDWHEIQGRAVVPYAAIYGIEQPQTIGRADTLTSRSELEVGTPFGLLGAASILDRETHPMDGIHFAGEHQFHGQGTDTIDYSDDDLCGVRILAVMPNRDSLTFREINNVSGERVVILGEIPVRNRDSHGAPRMDASGHPDTSFLVRFPANTPYLMQGVDCHGRTLNTDQSWQSLRPGEMKTCGGCHVHSRTSRVEFPSTFAATDEYFVPSLGEGSVPLLAGSIDGEVTVRTEPGYGLQIDFHRDILPIFERRCVSCHGGSAPMADLALDRSGVMGLPEAPIPSTWWCLVVDRGQQCVSEARRFDTGAGPGGTYFRRPQLTRYVRAFNALASPLYWKAAGHRTDGRTDDTFTTASPRDDIDLDFGPAHTTTITPDELGLLSRWIDIGAPGGPMELRDTQRPTLHLSAIVEGGAVAELRVGTVDVGSGIDTATLEVCVIGTSGACEANLAPAASPHGVVPIVLETALSDSELEVLARVRDLAGNETEVRRTIPWLLSAPPPPPIRPDGGGDGSTVHIDAGVVDGGVDAPGGGLLGDCSCRAAGAGAGAGGPSVVALALLGIVVSVRRRRATLRARTTSRYASQPTKLEFVSNHRNPKQRGSA
jgi:hypothetical protein